MAIKYEFYDTGDDISQVIYGATWHAQTFTPSIAHTITSVKLLLFKLGSPGTLTASIKAVDGSGHPTGADLCSGTTDGDTLPTGAPYEWREITLGAGAPLSAGTQYAIVCRALTGDISNRVGWRADNSSPTYAGGNMEFSTNSGGSWTTYTTFDHMFEEWGEPIVRVGRSFGFIIG